MSSPFVPRPDKQAHRNQVLAAFARSVWDVLCGPPATHRLLEEDRAVVVEEISAVAVRRMVLSGEAGGLCAIRFPAHGGFAVFQVEVAGAVVCRLQGSLVPRRYLDLIMREIPDALATTLAGQAWPVGFGTGKSYRLVAPAPAPSPVMVQEPVPAAGAPRANP